PRPGRRPPARRHAPHGPEGTAGADLRQRGPPARTRRHRAPAGRTREDNAMKVYRWEIVDTRRGEVYNHITRHLTRHGAERRVRRMRQRVHDRPGYELKVRPL